MKRGTGRAFLACSQANEWATTLEEQMSKRIISIAAVALTMVVVLPAVAEAQESGRIRATARVVSSLIPETQMAADVQLGRFARNGMGDETSTIETVSTKNGFAQVSAELLTIETAEDSGQQTTVLPILGSSGQSRVMLTVAYTAN